MEALYKFFKSVKLAIALILIIAVLSILATLIPQNEDPAFYFHRYSPLLARVMFASRFHAFFNSLLFLVPCVLFFVNLGVCAVDRLVGRWRRKAGRRFGPDLIHIGLLVLIAGALVSAWGRREGSFYLGQGDQIELPRAYTLLLLSYIYEQYPDGRPKDWISTVEVTREDTALLRDQYGELAAIKSGQGFEWQGGLILFRGIEEEKAEPFTQRAVFERWEERSRTAVYLVAASERIAEYSMVELSSRDLTGLKAVKDPGFIPVVVASILVGLGLALTFLQKRGDKAI